MPDLCTELYRILESLKADADDLILARQLVDQQPVPPQGRTVESFATSAYLLDTSDMLAEVIEKLSAIV